MLGSGLLLTTWVVRSMLSALPVYQATARITIQPDTGTSALGWYWIQTEIEKIHAKSILYPVITNLNLQARWAGEKNPSTPLPMEEACRRLRHLVEVEQYRSTSLLTISAKCGNPDEASSIANMMAQTYRHHRNSGPDNSGGQPLVEVVDAAEPPSRPSRARNSLGLLPVMLFAGAMVSLFAGYFLMRPVANTAVVAPLASGQ